MLRDDQEIMHRMILLSEDSAGVKMSDDCNNANPPRFIGMSV